MGTPAWARRSRSTKSSWVPSSELKNAQSNSLCYSVGCMGGGGGGANANSAEALALTSRGPPVGPRDKGFSWPLAPVSLAIIVCGGPLDISG